MFIGFEVPQAVCSGLTVELHLDRACIPHASSFPRLSLSPSIYGAHFTASGHAMTRSSPSEFRQGCKLGTFSATTGGACPGYAQANLVILPQKAAADFANLCRRNPVPIPLLGMTSPGFPNRVDDQRILADPSFDIRTDFPKYTIYKNGKLVGSKTDILDEWTSDSVGFLIGCSFSFEHALAAAGLPARNSESGKNVSMYLTTKRLCSAGIFENVPFVVSMRPYKLSDVERVRKITSSFLRTHGEPIDWGYDAVARLGIRDLKKPEFGDSTEIEENEIPVFWGCGVTAQVAASMYGSVIDGPVIGHAPGHMLVLDATDDDIRAS